MNNECYADHFPVDIASRQEDFKLKLTRLREVLVALKLDAVVLNTSVNFSWLTSGARNYILWTIDVGVGSLYVDADKIVLITNTIEGHRLLNEEMRGLQEHIQLYEESWFEQSQCLDIAKLLSASENVATDANPSVDAAIAKLRIQLSEYDMKQYRALGNDCGRVMGAVCRSIRPTHSEHEIAGELTKQCMQLGIEPVVVLVACDERIDKIRHPLPTMKRVKNKTMVVLCGRRAGLIVSLTRLVYITTNPGETIPEDLLKRHDAATFVDASALVNTKKGAVASQIFKAMQDAYAEKGFENEWKLHHQGGCTGFKSREWFANPSSSEVVGENQVFAWNPSVTGTKCEDTVLLKEGNCLEILSHVPDWPTIQHTVNGVTIPRPGILHIAY